MTLFKKALSLVLVSVLILACSSEDKIVSNPSTEVSVKDTYVAFSISIPNANAGTRAVDAKWSGRDKIESVDLFLINISKGTVDVESFKTADFTVNGNILTPTKAFKATSGEEVKAYALINGVGFEDLKKYSAIELDRYFSSKEVAPNFAANAKTVEKKDVVANAKTVEKKDVVAMTNKVLPAAIKIAPNVSAEQAIAGQNQIQIDVQRIAARGIVTVGINKDDANSWLIPVLNSKDKKASQVQVLGVSYAVGLSNKALFMIQKEDKTTPAASYTYVPSSHTEWASAEGVQKLFDFSGLANPVEALSIVGENINKVLEEEASSQFVLPVTHAAGNYRKGNTTYFEITVDFRPQGNFKDSVAYTEGSDIYVGKIDGNLYATEAAVKKANGNYFTLYKEGKMKYYVWLNPDKLTGAETSPTLRNTIYHANISRFKTLGFPTNPLDPTNPIDPANPIDPTTPLDNVDTYMSVSVKVLDWDVVSNNVEL